MVYLTQTTLCPKCKSMVKPIRKIGLRQIIVGLFIPIKHSYYYGEEAKSCPMCGYEDVYDEGLSLIKPEASEQKMDSNITIRETGLVALFKKWLAGVKNH